LKGVIGLRKYLLLITFHVDKTPARKKMPEKSRGRKPVKGGRGTITNDGPSEKKVSFEADLMDLDEKFEELTKPIYKGKKLDDPIPSAVVSLTVTGDSDRLG